MNGPSLICFDNTYYTFLCILWFHTHLLIQFLLGGDVPGIELDRRYVFMPLLENMVGDLGKASVDPDVPVMSMFEAKAGFFSHDKAQNGGPDSNANKWGEIFIGPALSG